MQGEIFGCTILPALVKTAVEKMKGLGIDGRLCENKLYRNGVGKCELHPSVSGERLVTGAVLNTVFSC